MLIPLIDVVGREKKKTTVRWEGIMISHPAVSPPSYTGSHHPFVPLDQWRCSRSSRRVTNHLLSPPLLNRIKRLVQNTTIFFPEEIISSTANEFSLYLTHTHTHIKNVKLISRRGDNLLFIMDPQMYSSSCLSSFLLSSVKTLR